MKITHRITSSTLIILVLMSVVFIWQNTTLLGAISCHQLIDDRLEQLSFAGISPGAEGEWVNRNFFLNGQQIYPYNDGLELSWQSLSKQFDLHRKGEAIWLEQFWRFSNVQIEDALRCLGEPDAYLSFGEIGPDAVLYTLGLLYEQEGYMVTAQYFYTSAEPPPVTKETPLFYIGFFPPGSARQIITQRYDDTLAQAVRPWPGDISQIEVPTIYVR
ncbi:MAG: hypothetical protein R3E79_55345 [Caldilineaceae bacterium]